MAELRPTSDFDLGVNIGSPRWFAGMLVLASAVSLTALLTFWSPTTPPEPVAETAPAAAPDETLDPQPAGPTSEASATAEPPAPPVDKPQQVAVSLKRGETLMNALIRAGATRHDAYQSIAAMSAHLNPRKLPIGQPIETAFGAAPGVNAPPALLMVTLPVDFDRKVVARLDTDGYQAAELAVPTSTVVMTGGGRIDDSLYLSAVRAGLPVKVIVEVIRIYSFDVDFQREIRPGDRFEILFERRVAEDTGQVEDGDILFARLTLSGRELPLYRFTPADDDRTDYFDGNGESVRKALMKTPIDGARLTSHFGNRKHPVLGYNRLHTGVDFGAPTGTPIMAAGDGVVERASRYGNYGNYVRIRHNSTYKTAYAHLSRYGRGIKKGVRVRQGQIIGYVGATGRVTGRHLHYEVHKDGKPINPMTLKLPSGRRLEGEILTAFESERVRIDEMRSALAATAAVLAPAPGEAQGGQ